MLAVLSNALLSLFIADFALLPSESRPVSTYFTADFMVFSDFSADFAFLAMDFILEATDVKAAAIKSVPTLAVIIAIPNAPIPNAEAAALPTRTSNAADNTSSTALSAVDIAINAINDVITSIEPVETSINDDITIVIVLQTIIKPIANAIVLAINNVIAAPAAIVETANNVIAATETVSPAASINALAPATSAAGANATRLEPNTVNAIAPCPAIATIRGKEAAMTAILAAKI